MKKDVNYLQLAVSVMVMLALVAMPLSLNAQAGKVSFSGTWTLNADKSDMGGGPGGPPQGQPGQGGPPQGARMGGFGGDFIAKQETNLLTVERTFSPPGGEPVTTTTKYTLDGKESVNSTGRGESKSKATWSSDGKVLTINTSRTFNMGGESRTMNSTEVWTLTDSKTLSVKTTMTTPMGDRTTTMVYEKK